MRKDQEAADRLTMPGPARVLSWRLPPKTLVLRKDEVHVWRVALDQARPRERRLRQTLSQEEHERAARFHFQRDRERFIVARGLLRLILGRYLDVKPSQLQFSYGPHGKPALASECGVNALRFNLSHSHELALYAVTRGRDVGVDVEHVRGDMDTEAIANRFFSEQETAILRSLAPEGRRKAFFACWTRKEAYIKARGEGLTIPPDSVSVAFAPGEAAGLLDVRDRPGEASSWSLLELHPDPSYAAALAVEGRNLRLRLWGLTDRLA
jgi:4'-phosphopantetheinyl transferase